MRVRNLDHTATSTAHSAGRPQRSAGGMPETLGRAPALSWHHPVAPPTRCAAGGSGTLVRWWPDTVAPRASALPDQDWPAAGGPWRPLHATHMRVETDL